MQRGTEGVEVGRVHMTRDTDARDAGDGHSSFWTFLAKS